jgi:hypothetical protein
VLNVVFCFIEENDDDFTEPIARVLLFALGNGMPHGDVSESLSPLTGDWVGQSDVYGFVGCLHSAVQKNVEFILWIDRRSGDYSVYGERITLSGDLCGNELRFFRDPSPIGNDRSFAGVLSPSAARIDEDWSSPANALQMVFQRVENGTCTLANSH